MVWPEPRADDENVAAGEELLAIGRDLAVFGFGLGPPGLSTALDQAALTDAELTAGASTW